MKIFKYIHRAALCSLRCLVAAPVWLAHAMFLVASIEIMWWWSDRWTITYLDGHIGPWPLHGRAIVALMAGSFISIFPAVIYEDIKSRNN